MLEVRVEVDSVYFMFKISCRTQISTFVANQSCTVTTGAPVIGEYLFLLPVNVQRDGLFRQVAEANKCISALGWKLQQAQQQKLCTHDSRTQLCS